MLPAPLTAPRRVLLTLDAIGGVWSYALEVARGLGEQGIECLLVGFGPAPTPEQRVACGELKNAELAWCEAPLDWTVRDEAPLQGLTEVLSDLAANWRADLLHLNMPCQAPGLPPDWPVVVASHSCVPSWWQAVRGDALPEEWRWHWRRNRRGFDRANAVLVPSASHGAALQSVYGELPRLRVIYNTVRLPPHTVVAKEDFVLSAGRWWDAGKNGRLLDQAAAGLPWPVLMAGPLQGPNGDSMQFTHARALGSLPPSELFALMRRAAVFAAPSLYEPFGLAVLEATMMGACLVLADIPTFRELWHDGAVFLPPTDVAAWTKALMTLAEHPSHSRAMNLQARQRAAALAPRRQRDELLSAYRAAIASQSADAAEAA